MFHAAAVIGDFNPREAFLASNPKLNRPALIAAEEAVLDGILDQRLNGERREDHVDVGLNLPDDR